MGLFQKNAASKLFSSSFAIESDDKVDAVDAKNAELKKSIDTEEPVLNDIQDGSVETILESKLDAERSVADVSDLTRSLSISQVIQLVRSLPQQGNEIELHAVLRTLELFNIDVRHVLEDSYRKESVTAQRIDTLLSEIDTLDEEIDKRAKEIKMLEVGITEMIRVNECLELMLKLDDELLEAEHGALMQDGASSDTPDYTVDQQASDSQDSSSDATVSNTTILSAKAKQAKDKLDEYVRDGNMQTLDGIVIDLDSPPKKKKLKLSRKAKVSKRKSKATAEQEA